MGVFRNFPYSNFHEMNMDEIIKIIKNMLEEWAQYHAEWDAWMDKMEDDWSNYQDVMNEAWKNMQDFINNYFDNLDVQEEINNKIVSMIQTGEFGLLVNEYIPPAVSSWLALNITQPTGVVIDTSLSVAGACADAKATGDAINGIKSTINNLVTSGTYIEELTWEHGGIDNANGQDIEDGDLTRSRVEDYMVCSDYDCLYNDSESQNAWIIYYDENKVFEGSYQVIASNSPAHIQNYAYFRLDFRRGLEYTDQVTLYKFAEFKKNINALEYKSINYDAVTNLFKTTPDLEWEQGTLSDAGGNEGTSTIRIRTSDYLEISKKGNINVKSNAGYIFQVYIWNQYKIYQGTTENLRAYSQEFPNGAYLRFVLKNTSDGSITPSAGTNLIVTTISQNTQSDDENYDIPTYWDTAIAEAEESINAALTSDERSASFAFVTDTHIGSNRGYSGLLMNKVMTDCHIPVWFHGGDAVTGSPIITKDNLILEMETDFKHFAIIENIGLRAIGNHDPAFGTSNYNYNLKNGEINQYYHGIDREKYLQIYGDKKGYFYKDIHKDKLRCICLDIIPYESQVDSDDLVTGSNKMWYHQFGSKQLEWFADVLANTPNGYSVVVCSHIAPVSLAELKTLDSDWEESVPIDYVQARKIAEAYVLKSTYSFIGTITDDTTGDSYNISVDFSSANGDFVCWFCGHTHKDFNLTLDNVLIVGTANDSISVSTSAPNFAPSKTAGTNTEQVIDFFCILPTTRTLKVVRLGAYLASNGKMRTLSY